MIGTNHLQISENVSLAAHTTFRIGGAAEFFVSVTDVDALRAAIAWAHEQSCAITILGGGSNVLVSDAGVRGLVIHVAIPGVAHTAHGDTILLTAGAGETFDDVVAHAVARNWWGIENLSRIPGSVGATPVQNVGAYGVELCSVLESVSVYDMHTGETKRLAADACAFGYRDSMFKHEAGKRYVILDVTFRLSRIAAPILHYRDLAEWFSHLSAAPSISAIRDAVSAIRQKKFPDWNAVGTAGSFFKNPVITRDQYQDLRAAYPDLPGHEQTDGTVKVPLGWVLDHIVSVRGYRVGAVGTYEGQALVIVNYGSATASDVHAFAEMLAKKIFDATGIVVEWEVTRW